MKFLLPITLLATAAAAQSTAACPAQNIVDSCLGTTKPTADDCGPSDYDCLCKAWTTILGCYDNCPNSADRTGVVNTKQAYCQYVTTSTTAAAATASAAATGGSGTQATTTGGSTGTSTSTAAGTTSTNSGADLAMNAGGVLAAVAGVVVAML